MLSPKGSWIASEEAVAGKQKEWRESHLSNDPLLVYNEGALAPTRVPPSQIEAGLIQEAGMAAQDLRDGPLWLSEDRNERAHCYSQEEQECKRHQDRGSLARDFLSLFREDEQKQTDASVHRQQRAAEPHPSGGESCAETVR